MIVRSENSTMNGEMFIVNMEGLLDKGLVFSPLGALYFFALKNSCLPSDISYAKQTAVNICREPIN